MTSVFDIRWEILNHRFNVVIHKLRNVDVTESFAASMGLPGGGDTCLCNLVTVQKFGILGNFTLIFG